jgi:hypothetical protein
MGNLVFRRRPHKSDTPLLLAGVQHFCRTRPMLLIERTLQAGLLVAVADAADSLGCQGDYFRDPRSTGILSQLQQCQGPQNHSDLLDTSFQKCPQLLLILLRTSMLNGGRLAFF